MRKYFLILSILFFISPAYAQKPAKNSLNLAVTPSYLLVRDEVLSPMVYRGSAWSTTLNYQRIRPKGTWTVGGTYMSGKNLISRSLVPEFRSDDMSLVFGEIFWEYMRHVKTTDKLDWKLGLNNTNTFSYRGLTYVSNGTNSVSTSIYNKLIISTNFIYYFNDKFLLSNYSSFNLFSYSFYQPISSANPFESSLISPFQFFDLQNSLLATWKASKAFGISLGYHFRWLRQSEEITYWDFAVAQQGFMVQTSLTW